jgi:hypothetical protein
MSETAIQPYKEPEDRKQVEDAEAELAVECVRSLLAWHLKYGPPVRSQPASPQETSELSLFPYCSSFLGMPETAIQPYKEPEDRKDASWTSLRLLCDVDPIPRLLSCPVEKWMKEWKARNDEEKTKEKRNGRVKELDDLSEGMWISYGSSEKRDLSQQHVLALTISSRGGCPDLSPVIAELTRRGKTIESVDTCAVFFDGTGDIHVNITYKDN